VRIHLLQLLFEEIEAQLNILLVALEDTVEGVPLHDGHHSVENRTIFLFVFFILLLVELEVMHEDPTNGLQALVEAYLWALEDLHVQHFKHGFPHSADQRV